MVLTGNKDVMRMRPPPVAPPSLFLSRGVGGVVVLFLQLCFGFGHFGFGFRYAVLGLRVPVIAYVSGTQSLLR